jgi:Zn-finger nucleic acid-binding protein
METSEIGRETIGSTVLVCKKCKTRMRAGSGWSLFCPKCLGVWPQGVVVDMVMSCVHCRKPLVINQADDNRVYGRCETNNCGDCNSMQDLCLITLPEKIGLEKPYIEPETIWREPITKGKKISRKPTLDQLDRSY